MTRYQLAKIIDWAGTLDSRKRMQKVVFMLKTAGCPIEVQFTLHHYGPYSQEVARLSDEMVQSKILVEHAAQNMAGQQYSYQISDDARAQIGKFEVSSAGVQQFEQIILFQQLALELLQVGLRKLEIASTIVFFRDQGNDWPNSVEKACQFKQLSAGTTFVQEAETFARRVIA